MIMQGNKFWRSVLLLVAGMWIVPGMASALDMKALVRKVEDQYNGASSHVVATMDIKTEKWQRSITVEGWSLGRELCLTKILKPAKEVGIATLKANKEVWNYLPRVDRVIRIPPSMMGAPWMGSHISNDDFVKASHVDLDYNLSLLEETPESWKICCLPKPDAAVVWGKIVYNIQKADSIPLLVEYFDETMVKVRIISFDEVRTVDNHVVPMRMTVHPCDKPNECTVLYYRDIDYDIPIAESFFSLRKLKAR